MTILRNCAAAGLCLLVGMGAALGQARPGGAGAASPGTTQPNQLDRQNDLSGLNSGASMQDKMFLKEATQGSNFEIQAAQLALQKSTSGDVKQFAQMMIADHTKLNEEMKPVAMQAQVTPPSGISKKDKAIYAKLQGLSGDAFDQAYIKDMVKDHTEDLKAFKTEASNGQLPEEKTAAGQGARVVQTHLEHAKQLAQAHHVEAAG